MDIMNLLSSSTPMAVAPSAGNAASTGSTSGSFHKELTFIMGQVASQSTESTEDATNSLSLLASLMLSETDSTESLSADSLMEQIDNLLDELDLIQLENLTEDQLGQLNQLLQQLSALMQIVSPVQEQNGFNMLNVGQEQQLTSANGVHQASQQIHTDIQDHLLKLQQLLSEGQLKTNVQNLHAEKLIGTQLEEIQNVLSLIKNGNKLEQAQTTAQTMFVQQADSQSSASQHLQKLNAQAVLVRPVLAAENANNQEALKLAIEQLNGVSESSLPLVKPDSIKDFASIFTKSSTPTAYVMADDFAETMKGLIVQKLNISTLTNGMTEAKIKLYPEELGQVDIRISMHNGILTALFQAETAMARDVLENQMAQLRASLAAQGITVEKIEVSQASFAAQLSQQQKQNSNQSFTNQEQNQQQRNSEDVFEEELVAHAAIRDLGFGRSVNEVI